MRRRIVLISQTYVPDPASVGQHIAGVAEELAGRGHEVTVYTSASGYADPSRSYPRRERRNGVDVVRLPWSSFGKRSMAARLAGGSLFLAQAILRVLARRVDVIVVTTSPPHAMAAATLLARVRRASLKVWVMDVNPEQAVAMGMVRADSLAARGMRAVVRRALGSAHDIVALDADMAKRIAEHAPRGRDVAVIPPWSVAPVTPSPASGTGFRARHGLNRNRVVMYSGNITPANPLDTMLAAIGGGAGSGMTYLFVGDGADRGKVERLQRDNVRLLPYQPLESLGESLAAADVHLVTMGNALTGLVHPNKIYGAMAAGRAILYCGPRDSVIGRLVADHQLGWQVDQGDVDGARRALDEVATAPDAQLRDMGDRARAVWRRDFDPGRLRAATADIFAR